MIEKVVRRRLRLLRHFVKNMRTLHTKLAGIRRLTERYCQGMCIWAVHVRRLSRDYAFSTRELAERFVARINSFVTTYGGAKQDLSISEVSLYVARENPNWAPEILARGALISIRSVYTKKTFEDIDFIEIGDVLLEVWRMEQAVAAVAAA